MRIIFFTLLIIIFSFPSMAEEKIIPRKIIALYSKKTDETVKFTNIHRMAEMPLNHLGLKLEYYDISSQPLPDIKDDENVRGVISWLTPGTAFDNPEEYINWAIDVIKKGKKFVLMGEPGFFEDSKGYSTPDKTINKFFELFGLLYAEKWVDLTYDVKYKYKNPDIVEYERKLVGFKPSYFYLKKINEDYKSHLTAQKGENEEELSHLIVTGPNGGYVAAEYAYFFEEKDDSEIKQWYINPLEFFRLSFATDDIPKPDTTTIAGRRIYYSHIDGDGWNNRTLLESYKKDYAISAQVILEKVIKEYKDLPVSVAAVAGDIDKSWFASSDSIKMAKKIFKQPNVELGTHTYSHPFFWKFFEDYTKEKERPYLSVYKGKTWARYDLVNWFYRLFEDEIKYEVKKIEGVEGLSEGYEVPRAYAVEEFSLESEIIDSIKTIESLAPDGKKVKILMWTGDTSPFEEAVKLTKDIKIKNINGGDSRFDRDYPSLVWVSPIGKQIGNQQQIYASNSNENTYTDLWTGRFFGFKYLLNTIRNTETPIRLKPFNVYYHMYSGEKQASLNALLDNLNYARTQTITPVTTSNYAAIAEGFYSADIEKIGENRWKILNRGALQTIRFDNNIFSKIDFENSKGVVGQRPYQGSLYVYLDENVEEPVISIIHNDNFYKLPDTKRPYLVDSRFKIYGLDVKTDNISFTAEGFGSGNIKFKIPDNGTYEITITGIDNKKIINRTIQVSDKILDIKIDEIFNKPVTIKVSKIV